MRHSPRNTQGRSLSGTRFLTSRNLLLGERGREISALSVSLTHGSSNRGICRGCRASQTVFNKGQEPAARICWPHRRDRHASAAGGRCRPPPQGKRFDIQRGACQPAGSTVKGTSGSILRFAGTGQLDFPISKENQNAGKRLACRGNTAKFGTRPDYVPRNDN